jgi:hypothetical protein
MENYKQANRLALEDYKAKLKKKEAEEALMGSEMNNTWFQSGVTWIDATMAKDPLGGYKQIKEDINLDKGKVKSNQQEILERTLQTARDSKSAQANDDAVAIVDATLKQFQKDAENSGNEERVDYANGLLREWKGKDAGSFTDKQKSELSDRILSYETSLMVYTSLATDLKSVFKKDMSEKEQVLWQDIRDTAESHDRLFIVEVMGRDAGLIALRSGIGAGAEAILIPETKTDLNHLIERLKKSRKGKSSKIIICAEGDEAGGAFKVGEALKKEFDFDIRVTILGHIQRGGSPSCYDRVLASRLGFASVEALMGGEKGQMVGIINKEIVLTPFSKAVKHIEGLNPNLLRMVEILSL